MRVANDQERAAGYGPGDPSALGVSPVGAGRATSRTAKRAAPSRRTIAPPRGIPNGRAVVGGLLVALAGLGSYLVATSGRHAPSARYAVAAHDLAPGDRLTDDDLRLVALDLPLDQARGTFATTATLRGAVMRGPLQAGAIVTASAVDTLDPAAAGGSGTANLGPNDSAYRELTVSLPAAHAVGGDLHPADRVDVVATSGGTSTVLVQHALVLDVSSARSGPLGGGDVMVTLALHDPRAALAVAHGASAAELTLLRSNQAVDVLPESYELASGTSPAGSPAKSAADAPGR